VKTFSHLWQYLAKCFFEWEMFYSRVVEKIKSHTLCSVLFFFFFENRPIYEVEKYGEARGDTNDVTMRCIRVAWISKGTCTHAHAHDHFLLHPNARAHIQIFISFPEKQWFTKALQCYVVHTLPVLLLHFHTLIYRKISAVLWETFIVTIFLKVHRQER
jgi:hypothetical protein